jgi:hypothetical protein
MYIAVFAGVISTLYEVVELLMKAKGKLTVVLLVAFPVVGVMLKFPQHSA